MVSSLTTGFFGSLSKRPAWAGASEAHKSKAERYFLPITLPDPLQGQFLCRSDDSTLLPKRGNASAFRLPGQVIAADDQPHARSLAGIRNQPDRERQRTLHGFRRSEISHRIEQRCYCLDAAVCGPH